MKNKILLIEDDYTLSTIISETLTDEGFDVVTAKNGIDGLEAFVNNSPELVISDIMMPRMDGFNLGKHIRSINPKIPLIFLTALSSIKDIETGFDIGADDYIKKPFKMRELILRIKALIKRSYPDKTEEENTEARYMNIGRFVFDTIGNTLTIGLRVIELSRIESMILSFLKTNEGSTVRSSDLMVLVWKHDNYYNRNSLHGYIYRLRNYLQADPDVTIVNLRGIGYRLSIKSQL